MIKEKAVNTGVSMYAVAGWLSILQAVIVILPKVAVDFLAKFMSISGSNIIQMYTGIHVVGRLLGIFVLFMFLRLLNERHSFHKVDLLIKILIGCHAAFALVGAVGLALNLQVDFLSVLIVISWVSSLISIIYAIRLLKLEHNLSGLLKPYAYATIAGGLLGVTLILGEYGRPFIMVSLILLGMILIRAESEPEYL